MTPEEIDTTVHRQVAALHRAGRKPRVVELGQNEAAALSEVGRGTQSFTTGYSEGEGPGFRHIGEAYPRTQVKLLHLDVLLVDERRHVRVTE